MYLGYCPPIRSYYFSGSLTTSPCSEDVTWLVLKRPVTVSAAEINQFSQLYRNNARLPQTAVRPGCAESK
jgi:carbonic anhydrase